MVFRFVLMALILIFSTGAHAAEDDIAVPPKADFTELRPANTLAVRRVIDPLRLELVDGRIVQLPGIDIPDMDQQEPGDVAVAATLFLRNTLVNKPVRLYQTKDPGKGRVNRMGYELMQVERRDGDIWIQGLLLANGLARVLPNTRNTEMAAQMLALENEARENRRGLWAKEPYHVLTPGMAGDALNAMAIVEGTVQSTAIVNNRIFLNFGPDWHTDFTIGIDPAVRRLYNTRNIDPMSFLHKKLRVHGWMENYNGPYISLTDPVWLEVLPSPKAP